MRENGRFETKLAEDISLHNHKAPVAGYTKGDRYREVYPFKNRILGIANNPKPRIGKPTKLKIGWKMVYQEEMGN